MNMEEEKNPPVDFHRSMAIVAAVILFITLAGVIISSQIDKYPPEATDAIETTEFTVEETTVSIETTEVSVETEAVTEPVTSETTLPLETSVETTEPPTEPVTEPILTGPENPSPDDNLGLLACVIYQEAGGNECCDDCRRRVADVVLNRMASRRFPNTIHGVLTQESQYGRFYWTGVVWPDRARSDSASEKAAVERAYRIAEEVLHGKHSELFGKGYIWQAGFIQGYDNIYCCGHYFGR